MIQAIVFTSNTGYTAKYAALLGEKTDLPVMPLPQAKKQLVAGTEIIYLGWLMAGVVKGFQDAAKVFQVAALCGVGMGGTGTQLQDVRKANRLPEAMPVFTLQGGFDITKLRGVYRFMMKIMINTAGKGLAQKPDRTQDEEAMVKMMRTGGDYVSADNLSAVLAWYDTAAKQKE